MDENCLEVWGANFASLQEAEAFMKLEDGIPKRFMKELHLDGKFSGHIETRFFEKKSNNAEELFADFPYGDRIIEVLKAKFKDKLKRRVNTAIVLYDFHLGSHFTGALMSLMKERKTDSYHIFNVDNVLPYK
ncbi:MAG: immunity 22 family protein [Lachnospiraceae bacterium]|nr:immunity 22 family protein [Lachnospiraceae bacterium]